MKTATTRRGLMKAAPIAAASLAFPALAIPPTDRSAWDAAMRAYTRAKAEDDAFTPGYLETYRRCDAACRAVPHVTFAPEAYLGGRCQTTADAWQVKRARREVASLDAGKMRLDPLPGLHEHYAIKRELVKAADERDSAVRAIRARFNMDALEERGEKLGDRVYKATWALMDLPAPDLAALRWKLDYLTNSGAGIDAYESTAIAQTLADIARLLPTGA